MKDINGIELDQLMGAENTVEQNIRLWSAYDWSNRGLEWCLSEEWMKSVVRYVIVPELGRREHIVEIGAGSGVWSEILLKLCNRLTLVDIIPQCMDMCRERLGAASNVTYEVNDGRSLGFIKDQDVDGIWALHTFVHINEADVTNYFKEFRRILKPGGVAVIHHGRLGNTALNMGWRSSVTNETIAAICQAEGLELVRQFISWGKNGKYKLWPYLDDEKVPDCISLIRQPLLSTNDDILSK